MDKKSSVSPQLAEDFQRMLELAGLSTEAYNDFEEEMLVKPGEKSTCDCRAWDCQVCFPADQQQQPSCQQCGHDVHSEMHEAMCGLGEELINDQGLESPMTRGGDNLGEMDMETEGIILAEPDGRRPAPQPTSPLTKQPGFLSKYFQQARDPRAELDEYAEEGMPSSEDELPGPDEGELAGPDEGELAGPDEGELAGPDSATTEPIDPFELDDQLQALSDLGLADREQSGSDLLSMSPDELERIKSLAFDQGPDLAEAEKKKPGAPVDQDDEEDFDPFGAIDLTGKKKGPLAPPPAPADDKPEDETDDGIPDDPMGALPRNRRPVNVNPTDQMRDWMSRINPEAGADEPELPEPAQDELVVRNAADLPAVIGNAMRVAGEETPAWTSIGGLPGYMLRNIRGMGRQVFGMMTRTPLESIVTIANVEGQDEPNTAAEVNAVAAWLRDNARDLGPVQVGHGMAIPGYEPQVRDYSARGIRFHVVQDPMGQYIYAWPEADSRINTNANNEPRLPQGPNMPRRLRESTLFESLSLYDRVKIHEILEEAIAEGTEVLEDYETVEESVLTRKLGKLPGARNLIRWVHKRQGLSDEASLFPQPTTTKTVDRLLWTEFKKNPDNFVIISAENGVAAIKPDLNSWQERKALAAKKNKPFVPELDGGIEYEVIAFKDDGERVSPELLKPPADRNQPVAGDPTIYKARMGLHTGTDRQNPDNIFNLLADQIGEIKSVWISTGIEKERPGSEAARRERLRYGFEPKFGTRQGKEDRTYQWQYPGVEREKQASRLAARRAGSGWLDPDPKKSISQSLDIITRRMLTPTRLKGLFGRARSLLARQSERLLKAGNYEANQEVGAALARISKLIQEFDLYPNQLQPNTKLNIENAIYNILVPTRTEPEENQARFADELAGLLGRSGGSAPFVDRWEPLIAGIIEKASKEGNFSSYATPNPWLRG